MKYSTKLSDALHILAFLSIGAGQRITSAKIIEGNKSLFHWDIDTNPECGVGIYVQLSIADFYQEIQQAAEEKMQTITLTL